MKTTTLAVMLGLALFTGGCTATTRQEDSTERLRIE